MALMIHVLYKGRALPLAWRVRQGPKGHFPEELHIALVALIRACLPEGTQVVLLGDGEFDGTTLWETLNDAGWGYVSARPSTVATWDGETFRLDTSGTCSKPGTLIALKEVKITRDAYGPVMVLSCWAKGYHEPLYLVSNMDAARRPAAIIKSVSVSRLFSQTRKAGVSIFTSRIYQTPSVFLGY